MTAPAFPSPLPPKTFDILRQQARRVEQARALTPEVLGHLYDTRLFQLMVPKAVGGLEWPLPRITRLFEELAYADGSSGWCVNLGAGANLFAGYFAQEVAHEIFASPRTCIAGSGALRGQALRTRGGYVVSGTWRYASGAAHATHFTLNAPLGGGEEAAFKSFLVPRREVVIHDTWDAPGLRGTSSHDFSLDSVFVPEAHVFSLKDPSPFASGPLYRFPFASMAVVNTAVMLGGAARHILEGYQAIATTKPVPFGDTPLAQDARAAALVDEATEPFYSAREQLYTLLGNAWDACVSEGPLSLEAQHELEQAARALAAAAREAVHALYPLFGMAILEPESDPGRAYRDIATMSQHVLLSPLLGSSGPTGSR